MPSSLVDQLRKPGRQQVRQVAGHQTLRPARARRPGRGSGRPGRRPPRRAGLGPGRRRWRRRARRPFRPWPAGTIPALTSRTSPAGLGDHRGRAFQKNDRPRPGGHLAHGRDPVVGRGPADQPGVLALVRGEHDWPPGGPLRPRPRWRGRRGPAGRRRPPRPGPTTGAAAGPPSDRSPVPPATSGPETRTDDQGLDPLQPAGRPRPPSHRRAGGGSRTRPAAGHRQAAHRGRRPGRSRPRPAWRRGPPASGAPYMPGEPATICTALCHLWASRGRAGHRRATSASVTSHAVAASAASAPRPMSATSTTPAWSGPSPSNSPGL